MTVFRRTIGHATSTAQGGRASGARDRGGKLNSMATAVGGGIRRMTAEAFGAGDGPSCRAGRAAGRGGATLARGRPEPGRGAWEIGERPPRPLRRERPWRNAQPLMSEFVSSRAVPKDLELYRHILRSGINYERSGV
jgi:hypothetical protein